MLQIFCGEKESVSMPEIMEFIDSHKVNFKEITIFTNENKFTVVLDKTQNPEDAVAALTG